MEEENNNAQYLIREVSTMSGSSMRDNLRDKREAYAKKHGLPFIECDQALIAEKFHRSNDINEVEVEELQRVYSKGLYHYNFKVKGTSLNGAHTREAFKELYEFINARRGLDKELGLTESDMRALSEGKEVKRFIWKQFSEEPRMMVLCSFQ